MLAIAMSALLVLATTAEAATTKYDYGGHDSYKHEDHDSYKPPYESHYFDQDYSHEPSYANQVYREPHRDSYEEDYGGDAYSEKPSYTYESRQTYKQSHEPRYRRSAMDGTREEQSAEEVGVREAQEADTTSPFIDEVGVREAQSCCGCSRVIRVASKKGWGNKGVRKVYSSLFTTYTMRSGMVNKKDHWVSNNGKYAIWNDKNVGLWWIGRKQRLDKNLGGWIRVWTNAKCPHWGHTKFNWKFWDNGVYVDAGEGLLVVSES